MAEFNGNVTPLKTSTECVDRGLFKFQNEDCYLGCFTANIKRELYREGLGKYFCNDGESYFGIWRKDKLVSAKCITYKDKRTYKGELNHMQMVGEGIYKIPLIGDLHIDFEKNKPSGDINLIDVNGYCWNGKCEDDSVILYPVNQFKTYRNRMTKESDTEMEREVDIDCDETFDNAEKHLEKL